MYIDVWEPPTENHTLAQRTNGYLRIILRQKRKTDGEDTRHQSPYQYARQTIMEIKYTLLWWWYSQKDLNRLFQVLASVTGGSAVMPLGIFLWGSFNLTDKWILYGSVKGWVFLYGSVKGWVSLLSLSYEYHRNEQFSTEKRKRESNNMDVNWVFP